MVKFNSLVAGVEMIKSKNKKYLQVGMFVSSFLFINITISMTYIEAENVMSVSLNVAMATEKI